MSITTVETAGIEKRDTPFAAGKKQLRRQKAQTGALHGASRFFLARKGATGEVPILDREIVDREHNDPEALARFEALKEGVTILEIVEWKPIYDASRKQAMIGKEAVIHKRA